MRRYCTYSDQHSLSRGLALHQSLLVFDGDFELTVLCLDDDAYSTLLSRSQPSLRLLPVADLLATYPELDAARSDRTAAEFAFTCQAWLLRYLLARIPAGQLLTSLAPGLFFFSSPEPVFTELGTVSVGIVPHRDSHPRSNLVHRNRFSSNWVSLRHDATGLACASAWAEDAAKRGFERRPSSCFDRRADQHVGTGIVAHPGFLVTPRNLDSLQVGPGPVIDGQPVVCYDFTDLVHLDRQLYDPGLTPYDVPVSPGLREYIYHPYLRALVGSSNSSDQPDIVPPANANDPRCGAVVATLAERALQAERARNAAELALEKIRADALRISAETQARTAESERYVRQVELDRDQQRQSFFATRQRLEEIHQDLLHNIAYLKKLEGDAAVAQQASVDREAYVASLKQQLAGQQTGDAAGLDLALLHEALLPHGREIRRLLVVRYHPALLPLILSLAAQGVNIDVLGSPSTLAGQDRGSVHFLNGELWTWLGGLNSLFDEPGYLHANPDVVAAITAGVVRSGWDHFQCFGQGEGRPTGAPDFRSGLADYDAVAFDSADAGPLVPCLVGRMQPYHRLFVSSSFNPATVWLPGDTHRTIILGDLLCCPRPPTGWLGPLIPSALPVGYRPSPTSKDLYPETPAQPAAWPKITVVTASHNNATSLDATLRSVLDQYYPMLEYLVVDAASTDGSADIIRRHAGRLAWWTSEPCHGPADALSKGFAKSSGSIVTWLNPGDRLAPGSLFTVALQFLLHIPDIIAGRCLKETGNGRGTLHRSVLNIGHMQPLPLPELLDLENFWLKDAFFLQPGVFLTRAAWSRAGGLGKNLEHAFDYDLWLRLARTDARVLPLPEVLARQGPIAAAASAKTMIEFQAIRTAQPAADSSA